jgi:hypothetical protein
MQKKGRGGLGMKGREDRGVIGMRKRILTPGCFAFDFR